MPTTLFRNGRIYEPTGQHPTAMTVDGESITWMGSDGVAESMVNGVDEVVDLDGFLVTPAFVDAHVHSTSTGIVLNGLDLTSCQSLTECLRRVEDFGRARRGGVVLGHGWDETRWPEHRPPTREELDRASYGGVVYLSRVDVHSAVVSSALLALAPEARGAAGYSAAGQMTAEAHHLVRRVARESVTPTQRAEAQRATRRRAAELGIGCVHELGGPDISSEADFTAMLTAPADDPGPDVIGYWGELGGVERARELGALGAAGDLFADGAIGSHTAYLRSVYADADHTGRGYLTAAQVRDHVVACTEADLQAGFHAIGDGALDVITAGFREAAQRLGVDAIRRVRHRLEHVEMVDAATIETLAQLGVVASVQPSFDALWGGDKGMYAERLGIARAATLNPFATMAASGVALALGSDSPVTPLDPWGTLRAAAFHHRDNQRLTVAQAFEAHTRGGWRAARRDDGGVLAVGHPATFAVWDRQGSALPSLDGDEPPPTCRRTVVRGRTIFER